MKAKTKYGHALRLASTTQLTREQWLAIRKLGIGSSDAAVAVGLSPYKCPLSLWLEKTGRKEPEDISHKAAVAVGHRAGARVGTGLCQTHRLQGAPGQCGAATPRTTLHARQPRPGGSRPSRWAGHSGDQDRQLSQRPPVGGRSAGGLPVSGTASAWPLPAMPGPKWQCSSAARIFGFTASSAMRRRS